MKSPAILYDVFKQQAERLLPGDADHQEMISPSLQEEKLDKSRKTLHFENLFFVIHNRSFSTEHAYGISHLLGYPDKTFTLKKFFSLVHPSHSMVMINNLYELLETHMNGERIIRFGYPLFVLNIALKHVNGGYLLFKWLAFPFQVGDRNVLLSYFNELTLISSYNEDICNLRITGDNGKSFAWLHQLSQRIKERFHRQSLFSEKERLILRSYISSSSDTNAVVAAALGIKTSSVITYNKRILRKAERMFMRHFKTAREVADYLDKEHLM